MYYFYRILKLCILKPLFTINCLISTSPVGESELKNYIDIGVAIPAKIWELICWHFCVLEFSQIVLHKCLLFLLLYWLHNKFPLHYCLPLSLRMWPMSTKTIPRHLTDQELKKEARLRRKSEKLLACFAVAELNAADTKQMNGRPNADLSQPTVLTSNSVLRSECRFVF